MKSRWRRFLALFIIIFALFYVAILWLGPFFAGRWAKREFGSLCQICRLEFGSARLMFFDPHRIEVTNLRLRAGTAGFEEIEIELGAVRASIDVAKALHGEWVFRNVELDRVEATLTDGDAPRPPEKGEGGELPAMAFEGIILRSSSFTYIRDHLGTHAVFHAVDVTGTISSFGTIDDADPTAHAFATGRLEKSGEVSLDLAVLVKPLKPYRIDLVTHVKNQNLADFNPFFQPNAGVSLKGLVVKADGRAEMRGARLTAVADATYKDFGVDIKPDAERSELMAFFTNLATSIALSERNTGKTTAEKTKAADIDREPHEPIVAFILRGLKEAVLKIARK